MSGWWFPDELVFRWSEAPYDWSLDRAAPDTLAILSTNVAHHHYFLSLIGFPYHARSSYVMNRL